MSQRSLTSSSSAKCTVVVASFSALADDFAVDVIGAIGVDVASAAAAVRYFGCRRHFMFEMP